MKKMATWLSVLFAACGAGASAADMNGGVSFDFARAPGFCTNDLADVTVQLEAEGFLDSVYHAPSGQCAIVCFAWHTRLKDWKPNAREADRVKTSFLFELPAGFALLDSSAGPIVRRTTTADGGTAAEIKLRKGLAAPRSCLNFLVRADAAPGTQGEGRFRVRFDGKDASNVARFTFKTVEPVKIPRRPKRYANGIDVTERFTEFPSPEGNRALARTLADAGVDDVLFSVCSGVTHAKRALWREAGGFSTLTAKLWWIANGFTLANPHKLPPELRFRPKEDPKRSASHTDAIKWSTCPVTVYTEGAHFLTNSVPEMTERLKGTDGLWANWEPYQFVNQGCCCARCREAFVKYLKDEDPARVRAGWPMNALRGGEYARYAEDFRSREHAKAVKTIDKYVRAATGGARSRGFIAGVEWSEMCGGWRLYNHGPETKEMYYAEAMRWINPWGPYVKWDSRLPYVYEKRLPLAHWLAAKDVREQVARDYPDPARRPKLMAYPQGFMCGSWVAQPEWLEMGLDSFFFNGWEKSIVYFFPEGYDARYLRAYANATARAARYEDWVWEGVRTDNFTRAVPVREYAARCKDVSAYVPQYRDVSPLACASYDRAGGRLVAVLNFWEKGEAFFTLRCERLAPGEYEILAEDGTLWAKSAAKRTWTAEDLDAGVLLEVGAARTGVWEILPAGRAQARRTQAPAETNARYAARRAALKAAADADAQLEKTRPPARRDHMATL